MSNAAKSVQIGCRRMVKPLRPTLVLVVLLLSLTVPGLARETGPGLAGSVAVTGIQPGSLLSAPTIAGLRQLPGTAGACVYLQGHTLPGDGGGGYFFWTEGKAPGAFRDDNALTIVPLSGNGAQAWVRESDGVVNVRWFGARGDGRQDDGPAINAAAAYLRSRTTGGGASGENSLDATLLIPPGRYRIATSINLTGFRQGRVWFVDARGAILLGHTPGKAVVDLLGSRACSWLGGQIVGDEKNRPLIGVQIGRADGKVADNHSFTDLAVTGFYTRASLYNYASEGSYFAHLRLANNDPSPTSYALIQDGTAADFIPVSDYEKVSATGPASFNENVFIRPDLRKPFGGPTAYLSRTARHSFIGAYFVSVDDAAVVLASDNFGHKLLLLDLHAETSADTSKYRGLQQIVRFEGAPVQKITGLTFRESNSHALDACFRAGAGVRAVTLEDVDIQVAGFFRGGKENRSRRVFAEGRLFRANGLLSVRGDAVTGVDLAEFKGELRVDETARAVPQRGN